MLLLQQNSPLSEGLQEVPPPELAHLPPGHPRIGEGIGGQVLGQLPVLDADQHDPRAVVAGSRVKLRERLHLDGNGDGWPNGADLRRYLLGRTGRLGSCRLSGIDAVGPYGQSGDCARR